MKPKLSGRSPLRDTAVLLCAAWGGAVFADPGIHSGPLPAIGGTGDRVECLVVNVGNQDVHDLRLVIRSTNFFTVVAQWTCSTVPPGAGCTLKFDVPGPALVAHLQCSAELAGRRTGPHDNAAGALRGTFLRTSSEDRAMDVAVEMR